MPLLFQAAVDSPLLKAPRNILNVDHTTWPNDAGTGNSTKTGRISKLTPFFCSWNGKDYLCQPKWKQDVCVINEINASFRNVGKIVTKDTIIIWTFKCSGNQL